MKRIHTKLHIIGTYDVCKIALSCFDDKKDTYQRMELIASLIFINI